ncbi:MAG: hypothetical protein AABY22_28570 [Nanoarchaeota archaeon]
MGQIIAHKQFDWKESASAGVFFRKYSTRGYTIYNFGEGGDDWLLVAVKGKLTKQQILRFTEGEDIRPKILKEKDVEL